MQPGAETFEKNLNALRETFPVLAKVLVACEPEASYGLCPAPDGGWWVWIGPGEPGWSVTEGPPDEETAQTVEWIHGPQPPGEQAETWLRTIREEDPELCVVYRCGLGAVVPRLFDWINRREAEESHDRRILILEDRVDLFRVLLHLSDWSVYIRSDRVFLAIDRDANAVATRFFNTYPEAALARASTLPGSLLTPEDETKRIQLERDLQAFTVRVEASMQKRAQSVRRRLHEERAEHVRRVLFLAPGHNYLQAACVNALSDLTHPAEHALEPAKIHRFTRRGSWLRHVERFQPDLIVGVNTSPHRFVDHALLDTVGALTAAWYVDNPARFADRREDFERTDLVACFDAGYLPWLEAHGATEPFALNTAAGLLPPKTAPTSDDTDLLFVGELGSDGFVTEERVLRETDPELLAACEEVLEAFMESPSKPLGAVYTERGLEERRPFRGYLVNYLENKATYRLRRAYLEPLAELNPVIYGPEEWGDPKRSGRLAGCWVGRRAEYGAELAGLYSSARVVLNVFHAQCIEGLNPRIYDVLVCGGLLATNSNPSLERSFPGNRELFTATDPAGLAACVTERLDSGTTTREENRAVAQQGKRRALVEHRYHARMLTLLERADRIWMRRSHGDSG